MNPLIVFVRLEDEEEDRTGPEKENLEEDEVDEEEVLVDTGVEDDSATEAQVV